MQPTEKFWRLISRSAMAVIVVAVVAGLGLAFIPKFREMQCYQQRCDVLQQKIDATEAAENDLKERQRRFLTDPSYVEKVAHEVGYARKDEIIFQFPDNADTNE